MARLPLCPSANHSALGRGGAPRLAPRPRHPPPPDPPHCLHPAAGAHTQMLEFPRSIFSNAFQKTDFVTPLLCPHCPWPCQVACTSAQRVWPPLLSSSCSSPLPKVSSSKVRKGSEGKRPSCVFLGTKKEDPVTNGGPPISEVA